MAQEIVFSGLGDQVLTEALTGKFIQLLADRNAMPSHPALVAGYQRDARGAGSNTFKVPHVGIFGYDILATGTEGSSTANTALSDGSSTITVVQKDKVYEYSDLVRMVDANNVITTDVFALDAVISAGATMMDLLANLVDNFSSTVGSSGVNATAANFLELKTTLNIAMVQGPYMALLHPRQWGDIVQDVTTASGGAIQWNPGSQAIISGMQGLGYQGVFMGVDVFTTTRVPTANAGADRAGGMFGAGAIVWADGTIPLDSPDSNQMVVGDKILFERVRAGRAGLTAMVTRKFIGMSEGLDGAGASLITDA
jgi:hypothetical protein